MSLRSLFLTYGAPSAEARLRDAAVAAEEARLGQEVETRRVRLQKAETKHVQDDPDWDDWLAHLRARVDEAALALTHYRAGIRERQGAEALVALDHDHAVASAKELVDAIVAAKGPSGIRVWARPGHDVRVYFPGEVGYLTVHTDGSVGETARGRLTFMESGLYPAWRRAVRAGRAAYAAGAAARDVAHGRARVARLAEVRDAE